MRVKIGSAFLVAFVALVPLTASAQSVDWATCDYTTAVSTACSSTVRACCTASKTELGIDTGNAVIIPMDRCHQAYANSGTQSADEGNTNRYCVDPNAYNAHGMFYSYGLVYRLMQKGIPVYWIINPTKTASAVSQYHGTSDARYPINTLDAWIVNGTAIPTGPGTGAGQFRDSTGTFDCGTGCTSPVTRLNSSSSTLAAATTSPSKYTKTAFPLIGGAFLINGNDWPAFQAFWDNYADGSPGTGVTARNCASGHSCWDFREVTLYKISASANIYYKNTFTGSAVAGLPVAVKIDYEPPRIARVDPGGTVSSNWLAEANLEDEATYPQCLNGQFSPTDKVYCNVTEADVIANKLVSGGFGWAWLDGGGGFSSCINVARKLKVFLNTIPGSYQSGNVMANDQDISSLEGCNSNQLLGSNGTGTGLSVGSSAVNETQDSTFIVRYPTNLFLQYGDIELSFASSSVSNWSTDATHKYRNVYSGTSTLKRLITVDTWTSNTTNPLCGDTQTTGDGWKKVAATSGGSDRTADLAENPHQLDLYPHNNLGSCAYYDVSSAANAALSDRVDMAAYGRYNNDVRNGVIFYTPGNNISTSKAELRIVLNSIIATPNGEANVTESVTQERTRSNPVIASVVNGTVNALVQGTTVISTDATGLEDSPKTVIGDSATGYTFPFRRGHMRAIDVTSAAGTFAAATATFDAGCNASLTGFTCPSGTVGIPQQATGANTYTGDCSAFPKTSSSAACRTIFTTSDRGSPPTMVFWDQNISTAVKNLIKTGTNMSDATALAIVQRVIAGWPDPVNAGQYISVLGAIDRSTTAVIEASNIARPTTAPYSTVTRPTMAYFGASDGMLHAVCADVNATYGCDAVGRELWAYIPRSLVASLRWNTAKINGSPRVIDAKFGTTWKTVLMFQTGMGDPDQVEDVPAVYAIDVTNPADPVVLWEYSVPTPTALGAHELGVGLTLAAGKTRIGGTDYYAVFVQANDAGTSGPGFVVYALNVETGATLWSSPFSYTYPNPRTSGNDVVADTAIPGGVVPIDLTSAGRITDLVFADLYGDVWFIDADTHTSHSGNNSIPLFKASADYYAIGGKPAILGAGTAQYAVFGTGGFADPTTLTWPVACANTTGTNVCSFVSTTALPVQFTMAVKLNSTLTAAVVTPGTQCDSDAGAALPACTNTNIRFYRELGQDERVYSQPLIVGDEVFFTADTTNVNLDSYQNPTTNTGKLYWWGSSGTTVAATTTIIAGASALASNGGLSTGKTVFRGGGTSFGSVGAATTSGTGVDSSSAATISRRVWLRTE